MGARRISSVHLPPPPPPPPPPRNSVGGSSTRSLSRIELLELAGLAIQLDEHPDFRAQPFRDSLAPHIVHAAQLVPRQLSSGAIIQAETKMMRFL